VALPKGLEETVQAFFNGCEEKRKERKKVKKMDTVTITLRMVERLFEDFKDHEDKWDEAQNQVKAVAGLSGRLAALYAERDGKDTVAWHHARLGLRDGQAECQSVLSERAKHCAKADFKKD
jgi:hypothetical protein